MLDLTDRVKPENMNKAHLDRLPTLMTKLDPGQYGDRKFADVKGSDQAEKGNLRGLTLFLNNTPLFHFSLFDLIGWCMSKAVGSPPAGTTKENFYFPLLTLFAHWCAVATEPFYCNIKMVSISWFAATPSTTTVILGATIPTASSDSIKTSIQTAKKQALNERPVLQGQRPELGSRFSERGQDFGHCAETNQYLLYAYL